MNLTTIKQYAENHDITYEAVRRQVARYSDELAGHIIKKGRSQYLDEFAVDFLDKRRRESPVVVVVEGQKEKLEELEAQIATLKEQLMQAQNELLKSQDKVISLQDEARALLADNAKYQTLLEDNAAKDEQLKQADAVRAALVAQHDADLERIEGLQMAAEAAEKARDEAQAARDTEAAARAAAEAEAASFTRSIFGFYRKRGTR